MRNHNRYIVLTITLLALLSFTTVNQKYSFEERRKLSSFPSFSFEISDFTEYISSLDKYLSDHFFLRNKWLAINNSISYYLFSNKEKNNLILFDDYLVKRIPEINEKSMANLDKYLNSLVEENLSNNKIYFSLVPNKSFYIPSNKYATVSYADFKDLITNLLPASKFIDLYDSLSIDSYYKTDHHWRQNQLNLVTDKILSSLGIEIKSTIKYELTKIQDFKGAYYYQSPIRIDNESFYILENENFKDLKIINPIEDLKIPLYDYENINSHKEKDLYQIFLNGQTPLIEITNDNSKTDESIIIFRDSYASSLAPLLSEYFSKITLIDLRYMPKELISSYVDFGDSKILFLLSPHVLNNSFMLR